MRIEHFYIDIVDEDDDEISCQIVSIMDIILLQGVSTFSIPLRCCRME